MSLGEFSIKKPISILVISVAVVVLGLFTLSKMSVDLLPRITYPLVRINVDWRGAGPSEVEENITKKLESSVATTEDAIKVVSS